jgi:hypothetical protein
MDIRTTHTRTGVYSVTLNTVVKACRLDKRGILKIFLIGKSINGRMASWGRAKDESNDKLGVMRGGWKLIVERFWYCKPPGQ